MSVLSVQPVVTRVNGEANGHRTYTSSYRVITDDLNDGATIAITASGIPGYGDWYSWGNSYDYGAWVQAFPTADLQSAEVSRKVWIVTVVHTSQGRTAETSQPDDPLSTAWEVSGDDDEWTEEAFSDIEGKPIVNSALRAISGKPVEVVRTRGRFTLTRNYLDISWRDDYKGTMNSSAVTICGKTYPKWTLRIRRIPFQRLYHGVSSVYYRVTFVMDESENTFNLRLVDKGRHKWDGSGAKDDPESYIEIVDVDTQNPQPDGSYYLDGEGGILKSGDDAVILNDPDGFQVYRATDFNRFGFPAT